ncbi:3-oxoacyl-ACP reductase FabG [Bacillus sp. FJAT-29953]|nr:3-oxoacyl-ACP reductase FabG [Bacillus sp. FJAT-29953]
MDLRDQVAIVTGATRGIGRESALLLAKHGADIVVVGQNMDKAEDVVREIRLLGRKAIAISCDVSKQKQVQEMVHKTVEEFNRIDILVNNAGVTYDALLHKMTEMEFDRVIDVHMKGTFFCMQSASRYMKEQDKGKIINISSIGAKVGNIGQVSYSGAKAGIIGMTKAAAQELAKWNVNVNAIQPGMIDTDMTRAVPQHILESKKKEIPMGRAGNPIDIAKVVVFLSSDYSDYMTGNVVEVAGGLYM